MAREMAHEHQHKNKIGSSSSSSSDHYQSSTLQQQQQQQQAYGSSLHPKHSTTASSSLSTSSSDSLAAFFIPARAYRHYTPEQAAGALQAIRSGMPLRQVAETFSIPRRTACYWRKKMQREGTFDSGATGGIDTQVTGTESRWDPQGETDWNQQNNSTEPASEDRDTIDDTVDVESDDDNS